MVKITVTCVTPECENEGIPLEILVPTVDEAVICGPCGATLQDPNGVFVDEPEPEPEPEAPAEPEPEIVGVLEAPANPTEPAAS